LQEAGPTYATNSHDENLHFDELEHRTEAKGTDLARVEVLSQERAQMSIAPQGRIAQRLK